MPLRKLAHAIYRSFFSEAPIEIFIGKKDNYNIFAQSIDCGYKLTSTHIYDLEQI